MVSRLVRRIIVTTRRSIPLTLPLILTRCGRFYNGGQGYRGFTGVAWKLMRLVCLRAANEGERFHPDRALKKSIIVRCSMKPLHERRLAKRMLELACSSVRWKKANYNALRRLSAHDDYTGVRLHQRHRHAEQAYHSIFGDGAAAGTEMVL